MQQIASLADVAEIERTPVTERLLAGNVYEAIGKVAKRTPDKVAIHFLPTGSVDDVPVTLTYRDFFGRITQTANLLHSLGVGPGDTVSSLLPILPQTFQVMWAAVAAGAANPINPFLETPHIVGILKEARSKVLVGCDASIVPDIWSKIEAVRRELPDLKAVLWIGPPDRPVPAGAIDYDRAIRDFPADRLLAPRAYAPDDVAALFHTGGTTGVPKLAQHTHLGQMVQAWSQAAVANAQDDSVGLNGLPMFHVGGAMCAGLSPFCNGTTVVLLSPMGMRNPNAIRDFFRIAERYRATTLGVVPTIWSTLLNQSVEGIDLSRVRFINTGGAGIPLEVAKAVERKLGRNLIEGYGMTEVHGFSTMNPLSARKLGSVGIRVPYTEVVVARLKPDGELDRPCAPDEIGAVLMRGPQLFKGYVNPSHNKGVLLKGGWLNSGDLGRMDSDGYLWLTGRAKDLIIRGGHNIDPATIEEVLHQHPAVAGAAAVGRPDRYAGELPVAYVQLKPGAQATPEELVEFAKARIAERAATPVEIFVLPELPVTGVGKIFKPALRFDAAQRTLARVLQPLAVNGIAVAVEVGPHRTHGTFATIRLTAAGAGSRAALEAACREQLGQFQIRYELVWQVAP